MRSRLEPGTALLLLHCNNQGIVLRPAQIREEGETPFLNESYCKVTLHGPRGLTGCVCFFSPPHHCNLAPFCAQANSSLLTSDCSERCSCSSSTGQTCQAASCPPGRVCEVQAGVRDCWVSRGLCSLSVDANLTTFDGARSVVSSPGIYELSFRCPGLQETVPWYRVVADVWPCDSKAAVLGHVHIFFQDGLVTVTRKKGVWVSLDTGGMSPLSFVLPVAVSLHSWQPSKALLSVFFTDLCSLFLWISICVSTSNLVPLFWLSS